MTDEPAQRTSNLVAGVRGRVGRLYAGQSQEATYRDLNDLCDEIDRLTARVAELEAELATVRKLYVFEERDRLRAALGIVPCPRPFNGRPYGFLVSQCCKAHECGCVYGDALGLNQPLKHGETAPGIPSRVTVSEEASP